MKKLMTIILALTSYSAFAQDVPPAYMKDAVITVTLKNGKTYTYSANEYKVVRRGTGHGPQVKAAIAKMEHFLRQEERKNRVTLHAGIGFNGNTITSTPNQTVIEDKRAPVFGISYSRELGERYSITGTALTNSTFLLGVGLDY
jgi:hypothetical protein